MYWYLFYFDFVYYTAKSEKKKTMKVSHCPFKISLTLFLSETLTLKEPTYYTLTPIGKLVKPNQNAFLRKAIQTHGIIVFHVKTSLTPINKIGYPFLSVAMVPIAYFYFRISHIILRYIFSYKFPALICKFLEGKALLYSPWYT